MPKPSISAGTFLAKLSAEERELITAAQDEVRAERQRGTQPHETIELSLEWAQAAIRLYRKSLVTKTQVTGVVAWILRNPEAMLTIEEALGRTLASKSDVTGH